MGTVPEATSLPSEDDASEGPLPLPLLLNTERTDSPLESSIHLEQRRRGSVCLHDLDLNPTELLYSTSYDENIILNMHPVHSQQQHLEATTTHPSGLLPLYGQCIIPDMQQQAKYLPFSSANAVSPLFYAKDNRSNLNQQSHLPRSDMVYNRGTLTSASTVQEETAVEPDPLNQDHNGYNNDSTEASGDLDFMAFRNSSRPNLTEHGTIIVYGETIYLHRRNFLSKLPKGRTSSGILTFGYQSTN